MYLEFFSTEPLETLIDKRANFIAHSQHRDPAKWYNGLISDRNMLTDALLGPDNYDLLRGFRIYEVSCDDPGLCKPAFLAAKNADYPVQSEVEAMDYYLQHFVWGGLQRTTNETYAYGIYGIPDWKKNRESTNTGEGGQLHLWREYDYPHVLVMYEAMYRVAKYHPEIKTALTAGEYLERARGTAEAMVIVPREVDGGGFDGTGFYNELVFLDIIRELEDNGLQAQADKLRGYWERKVRYFVNQRANLFQSEYAFDTTGFESTEALAKYAVLRSDPSAAGTTGFGFYVTPEKSPCLFGEADEGQSILPRLPYSGLLPFGQRHSAAAVAILILLPICPRWAVGVCWITPSISPPSRWTTSGSATLPISVPGP